MMQLISEQADKNWPFQSKMKAISFKTREFVRYMMQNKGSTNQLCKFCTSADLCLCFLNEGFLMFLPVLKTCIINHIHVLKRYEPLYEKTNNLHMRNSKVQINCVVTAQLISTLFSLHG